MEMSYLLEIWWFPSQELYRTSQGCTPAYLKCWKFRWLFWMGLHFPKGPLCCLFKQEAGELCPCSESCVRALRTAGVHGAPKRWSNLKQKFRKTPSLILALCLALGPLSRLTVSEIWHMSLPLRGKWSGLQQPLSMPGSPQHPSTLLRTSPEGTSPVHTGDPQ